MFLFFISFVFFDEFLSNLDAALFSMFVFSFCPLKAKIKQERRSLIVNVVSKGLFLVLNFTSELFYFAGFLMLGNAFVFLLCDAGLSFFFFSLALA